MIAADATPYDDDDDDEIRFFFGLSNSSLNY